MPRVLVFCDAYLPGFKTGGPIPSISRIVETDATCEFRIVTRDRDIGDSDPYPNVRFRSWNQVGSAEVAYLRPGYRDLGWLRKELRSWTPDYYYLNSLQSPFASLVPLSLLKVAALPKANVVIAPRGETSPGARAKKSRKKAMARPAVKLLVPSNVTWHASSEMESDDISAWWGSDLPLDHTVRVQRDLAVAPASNPSSVADISPPVVTFASRIDRMKGLDVAIALVERVSTPYLFEIHGTVGDEVYWKECLDQIGGAITSDQFVLRGEFTPDQAPRILAKSAVLVLPTHGENFGHIIAEALSVGCPVVVPPTTPWTEVIEAGGGHVLTDSLAAVGYINEVLADSPAQSAARRGKALQVYGKWYEEYYDLASLFAGREDSNQGRIGRLGEIEE